MTTPKIGRTRKAKARKVVIAFHSDNGPAHPAINVKVYRLPDVDAPPAVCESAWDRTVEQFWFDAAIVAQQHGYSGVFSEGRSSGWLVPFYQYLNGKLQQFEDWPGQGPQWGYPTYPDVDDPKERRRFVRFRADIEALVAESREIRYPEFAQS